jgi:peptidyl-tRNA hydrolase, PTH1 family
VRAIIGIGNPGNLYKNNRHNVGFQFLDFFAEVRSLSFRASKFDYYYSEGELSGIPFVLIKPNTYVNLSGVAVLNCITNYKININDVLPVVDDINLDTGLIRIRKSGGDGGHNGLSSIIYHLKSNDFPRLRIGIGSDFKVGGLSNYVLSDFDKNDFLKLNKCFDFSLQLIEAFISDGFHKMLNTFSRLKREEKLNSKSE